MKRHFVVVFLLTVMMIWGGVRSVEAIAVDDNGDYIGGGTCGFCGTTCQKIFSTTMCPQVMPPEGQSCVLNPATNGCEIKYGVETAVTAAPTKGVCQKVTLSTITKGEPCGTDSYKNVYITCSDNQRETLGGPTSCKTFTEWEAAARTMCGNRSNLNCISPTPDPTGCKSVNGEVKVTPIGGEGSCHDIQKAIDAAAEYGVVRIAKGEYVVNPIDRNGVKIGLYINKIVGLRGSELNDNDKPVIRINGAYIGVWIDKVSSDLKDLKIVSKDILEAVVVVDGSLPSRSEQFEKIELVSEGNVPTLLKVKGLIGAHSFSTPTGIINSVLSGAEKAAIELVGVSSFNIIGNKISASTVGVKIYDTSNAEKIIIDDNTITNVRAGILSWVTSPGVLSNSEVSGNIISNFGTANYKLEAEKHRITSASAIDMTYIANTVISGNKIVYGNGIGIFLSNSDTNNGVVVTGNVVNLVTSGVAMSGGRAVFKNNNFVGDPVLKGNGVSITSNSEFINNIVRNVGDISTIDNSGNKVVSEQCALGCYNEGQVFFDSSKVRNNIFFENEKIYCSSKCTNRICSFVSGTNGNKSVDPMWGNDYCLTAGSPALTGGENGGVIGARGVCVCGKKNLGDANCDGVINIDDFQSWKKEFVGQATTKNADFNNDGQINFDDFARWKAGYLGLTSTPAITGVLSVAPIASPTKIPTATPTKLPNITPTKVITVTPTKFVNYVVCGWCDGRCAPRDMWSEERCDLTEMVGYTCEPSATIPGGCDSKPIVGPSPAAELPVGKCHWCGTRCTKVEMACIAVAPPYGKSCIENSQGMCEVVDSALVPTRIIRDPGDSIDPPPAY